MPKKLLLIGATGRLGSQLRGSLSGSWDILSLSRTGKDGTGKCDLLLQKDIEQLREAIRGCQAVVNCAAVSSPAICRYHPMEAWQLNLLWPLHLSRLCRRMTVKLVHFSSDLVYSGANPPYTETSPAVPLSYYGWTKLIADELVLRECPEALVIRTSVICGAVPSHRSTFSEEILSGTIRKVFVNNWRNHTPGEWLSGLVPNLLADGEKGLVTASGRYSLSRSAYAEALLRKHGESAEQLEQAYAPKGIPTVLDLRGRFRSKSVFS
ncbi:MAG: sugar nucleotide-binding protein [Candidatus Aegiribacteria sp.]|nr:sugar nucleotide-binding protein [Candidatus Aegiribacteria sp.]MBD3294754.1 sugar nucleotide-binding protein [Candidatus Fermentibacteria bacterium]